MNTDDLDTYDGYLHDGWIDIDNNENIGELSVLFEDSDLDHFIDNINYWT